MKLEVGMYVRTKKGNITKIIDKRDVSGSLHREEMMFILDNGNRLALHSQKVVKASHNIIDLIEVGDYVNGYKVRGTSVSTLLLDNFNMIKIEDYEIKSIVTKEQFESMKYSLEE